MPIYGKAGHGLAGDTGWAVSEGAAHHGAVGEARTEQVLNRMSNTYDALTVMHDLKVPGSRGNIDHLIVVNGLVLLVDSKMWKPGFVWTFGGHTRRGFEPFPAADKTFLGDTALKRMRNLAPEAEFPTPAVVVWPSNDRKTMSLWAARMPGCRLMKPSGLRRIARQLARRGPASDELVNVFKPLLVA